MTPKDNDDQTYEYSYELNRERDNSKSSVVFSNTEVFKHFEKCGFLINPRLIDFIAADIEIYSAQWLMDAADLAMERGKINYKYVQGILQNWKSEGRNEDGTSSKSYKDNRNEEGKPKYNFDFD